MNLTVEQINNLRSNLLAEWPPYEPARSQINALCDLALQALGAEPVGNGEAWIEYCRQQGRILGGGGFPPSKEGQRAFDSGYDTGHRAGYLACRAEAKAKCFDTPVRCVEQIEQQGRDKARTAIYEAIASLDPDAKRPI